MNRYRMFSYGLSILIIIIGIIGTIVLDLSMVDILLAFSMLLLSHMLFKFLSRKQNKIVCDNCDQLNPMDSVTCTKCGKHIENVICPVCKGVNPYNQQYCVECQNKLIEKKV